MLHCRSTCWGVSVIRIAFERTKKNETEKNYRIGIASMTTTTITTTTMNHTHKCTLKLWKLFDNSLQNHYTRPKSDFCVECDVDWKVPCREIRCCNFGLNVEWFNAGNWTLVGWFVQMRCKQSPEWLQAVTLKRAYITAVKDIRLSSSESSWMQSVISKRPLRTIAKQLWMCIWQLSWGEIGGAKSISRFQNKVCVVDLFLWRIFARF